MDFLSFPIRIADGGNRNIVDDIDGGQYAPDASETNAPSRSDRGDDDSFSNHMQRDDKSDAPADKKSPPSASASDNEQTKEHKTDDGVSNKEQASTGETDQENSAALVVSQAASKEQTAQKNFFSIFGIRSPSTFTELVETAISQNGETQALSLADNQQQLTTGLFAGVLTGEKAGEAAFAKVGQKAASGDSASLITRLIAARGLPGQTVQVQTVATGIGDGLAGDGAIELDPALTLEGFTLDLPDIDITNAATFRAVKTAPLTNQYTLAALSTSLQQTAGENLSVLEGEPEIKPLMAGTDTLTTMRPSLVTIQPITAAVATSATAQLVAAIKTEPKSGNIELRLDPPEMGRVRISLSVETADAVKAVLTVERPETLDHLRRNMSQFTEDLRMAGFTSVDVAFSENDGSAFQNESGNSDIEALPSFVQEMAPDNIVYLSLRDNAQLDLLV